MTAAALASVPAFGLRLDPNKPVLYKITVNDIGLVPRGITKTRRLSDKAMDAKHAEAAREHGDDRAAMDGRVRPGRVDTGNAVYQNVGGVQIGSIRSLMALTGYRLGDVHYYVQPAKGRHDKEKYVIVMYLSTSCVPVSLSEETVEDLRALARGATCTAHVWDNADTQTLNFVSRQPGSRPEAKIVVRGGFIKIVDVDSEQDVAEIEREEDLMSITEIQRLFRSLGI